MQSKKPENNRKSAKPQFAKEPGRLQAPLIVYYSKPNPTNQDVTKRRSSWKSRNSRKQQYELSSCTPFNLCDWYKRRKARKELIRENKKEKERRRREYEQEIIDGILHWEQAKQLYPKEKYEPKPRTIFEEQKEVSIKETKYEPVAWPFPKKKRFYSKKTVQKPISWSTPVTKEKKKKKYIKETSTTVKPRYGTKHVSVKKVSTKDTITNRFVNYCYRACCEFYCCLTCILVIAFVVIFIL